MKTIKANIKRMNYPLESSGLLYKELKKLVMKKLSW